MLRVTRGCDEVEVRFDHQWCSMDHIESITGISVGGQRRCSLATVNLNGEEITQGMAICHPIDNFCRATGRKKALAIGLHSLSKELRTAVWAEYEVQCGF